MLSDEEAAALAAIGNRLGPDVLESCTHLFDPAQVQLSGRIAARATDIAYGAHPRHRLDLYGTGDRDRPVPVLLFVHGGGFVHGDKGDGDRWLNANVGRMAADAGMIGAVMNYRLAPEHKWPSGGEDVGLAIDWLHQEIGAFGGDPEQIFLVGTSAGAVHAATHIKLRPDDLGIAGAVLLSGLYGFTPLDERDLAYHSVAEFDRGQSPKEAMIATDLPLLLCCAEYDPPRFQREFLGLLDARLDAKGSVRDCYIARGHNHYSLSMHLGTADMRLANEMIDFIRRCRS